MKSVDEMITNRGKRPLYHRGQRITIAYPYDPALDGWQGVVLTIKAIQDTRGYILTYYYRLEMNNLAQIEMAEEHLTPCADAPEEGETMHP